MGRKQRWGELTSRQKASVLGLIAVQAIIVAAAERDLSSRSSAQVRGPRTLWRVLTLNTVGAVAYFVVGRR